MFREPKAKRRKEKGRNRTALTQSITKLNVCVCVKDIDTTFKHGVMLSVPAQNM